MSIFRLESAPHHPIDSRYVETLDLLVTNIGAESFEMLVHAYNPHGLFYVGQIGLESGAAVTIRNIGTHRAPFTLLLVSNYHTYHTTGIALTLKSGGQTVAFVNQANFTRMH